MERSARAIEQVAETLVKANAMSGSEPLYQGPTWSLDSVRGSKYAVNNTPYLQANVVITGAPIRGDSESPGDVAPFGERQFMAISAWGLGDDVSYQAANTAITKLVDKGILRQRTSGRYDRIFQCDGVLAALEY